MNSSLCIYLSFLLSSWGDRMWHFSLGIFLVRINSDLLTLTAILGLSSAVVILIGADIIGKWVDCNPRLKVITISLLAQNLLVIACSILISVYLINASEHSLYLHFILKALIVLTGVIASLASMASKVAIERDWIVVVADNQPDLLARLNSMTRLIDQMSKVMSPILIGLIMTHTTLIKSSWVIAGWNFVSFPMEYLLLRHLFYNFPQLSRTTEFLTEENLTSQLEASLCRSKHKSVTENYELCHFAHAPSDSNLVQRSSSDGQMEIKDSVVDLPQPLSKSLPDLNFTASLTANSSLTHQIDSKRDSVLKITVEESRSNKISIALRECCLCSSWQVYFRQSPVLAGIALAFLYASVVGFDSITVGYLSTLGLSESIIGICIGLAGLFGIAGVITFSLLRHRLDLVKIGVISFIANPLVLLVSVISLWLPGTVFSVVAPTAHKMQTISLSVGLFMASIIAYRWGLWICDLTVTQLMQERVPVESRGVVGTTQHALNTLFDSLRFMAIIVLPSAPDFGFLVIGSFGFIFTAGIIFSVFALKWRN